jgi:hypothetical protein
MIWITSPQKGRANPPAIPRSRQICGPAGPASNVHDITTGHYIDLQSWIGSRHVGG